MEIIISMPDIEQYLPFILYVWCSITIIIARNMFRKLIKNLDFDKDEIQKICFCMIFGTLFLIASPIIIPVYFLILKPVYYLLWD